MNGMDGVMDGMILVALCHSVPPQNSSVSDHAVTVAVTVTVTVTVTVKVTVTETGQMCFK